MLVCDQKKRDVQITMRRMHEFCGEVGSISAFGFPRLAGLATALQLRRDQLLQYQTGQSVVLLQPPLHEEPLTCCAHADACTVW